MSKLSTQPYKGTRDFYPEYMRIRKWMFDTWRKVSESFGYEEYDGPILEPFELYASKTSDEIVNEQTYSFTDRGDRKVVMRPEMTPTVSRMVAARRQELAYPVRLYSIPNCFRYERPQKGRLREFWQYNADLFGVAGVEADVEIISLADQIVKAFDATTDMYSIVIGSRQLTDWLLETHLKVPADKKAELVRLIDRKDKMSETEFEGALKKIDTADYDDIMNILSTKEVDALPDGAPVETLAAVLDRLEQIGITNARWDVGLMRGFDYYTDIVFEVFDENPENNRSMYGGGRYDGLVGEFGVEPVPTIGFAMGDATFLNFLEGHQLLPDFNSGTDVYIVTTAELIPKAQEVATNLREGGINVAVDLSGRKTDKQLTTAYKKGIGYAIIIDSDSETYTLRNLETKENAELSIADIATELSI